ncbi:uncharacterized protein LOC115634407 [Scaptodrosophila lebanonensis]|uniref:Uncharacterized protein LOC115634407 n=1 Tax=Drosophila lebanonensis TaxID=7225 RepID=A0A6J2UKG4_DROLE|nr:uncharacterized protein LOC115634407 [Scaptodrosophila lebanonensis]
MQLFRATRLTLWLLLLGVQLTSSGTHLLIPAPCQCYPFEIYVAMDRTNAVNQLEPYTMLQNPNGPQIRLMQSITAQRLQLRWWFVLLETVFLYIVMHLLQL